MSKPNLYFKGLLPKTAFLMAKAPMKSPSTGQFQEQLNQASPENFRSSAPASGTEFFFSSMKELEDAVRAGSAQYMNNGQNLVMGEGSLTADLVFVGERLNAEEEALKRPFVGAEGALLDKMILAMGLKREEVYLTSFLKYRVPDDHRMDAEEERVALSSLKSQLQLLQPKIVIALGPTAAHSLLNTRMPLQDLRGELHPLDSHSFLIATDHPSFLIQYPAAKRATWEDLKKGRDHLLAGARVI